MGYRVVNHGEHSYEERPYREDEPPRLASDLTTALGLQSSRARLWRYPPRTHGRRHLERVQEEVFVVVSGTVTMLLGEPPERVELAPESVVAVEPGTLLQLRNDRDEEAVVFIYGAPPATGSGEVLEDAE